MILVKSTTRRRFLVAACITTCLGAMLPNNYGMLEKNVDENNKKNSSKQDNNDNDRILVPKPVRATPKNPNASSTFSNINNTNTTLTPFNNLPTNQLNINNAGNNITRTTNHSNNNLSNPSQPVQTQWNWEELFGRKLSAKGVSVLNLFFHIASQQKPTKQVNWREFLSDDNLSDLEIAQLEVLLAFAIPSTGDNTGNVTNNTISTTQINNSSNYPLNSPIVPFNNQEVVLTDVSKSKNKKKQLLPASGNSTSDSTTAATKKILVPKLFNDVKIGFKLEANHNDKRKVLKIDTRSSLVRLMNKFVCQIQLLNNDRLSSVTLKPLSPNFPNSADIAEDVLIDFIKTHPELESIRLNGAQFSNKVLKAIAQYSRNLKSLQVANSSQAIDGSILLAIAKNCQYLTKLTLDNVKNSVSSDLVVKFILACKALNALGLNNNENFLTTGQIYTIIKSRTSWQALNLRGCDVSKTATLNAIGLCGGNLNTLNIMCTIKKVQVKSTNGKLLTEHVFTAFNKIFSGCSNLVALRIDDTPPMKSTFFSNVRENCNRLQHLVILNRSDFKANQFVDMLNNKPIITLNLDGCSSLDNKSIISILKNCETVKSFNIKRCPSINNDAVTGIIQYGKNLKEIFTLGTGINEKGLLAIAQGIPGIKINGQVLTQTKKPSNLKTGGNAKRT